MSALFTINVPFILASQSPRRRELLDHVNLNFSVEVSPADETLNESFPPAETARRLARRKAAPVARSHPAALVLAADTIVAHENEILGKPENSREAAETLRRLSDSTHSVYTGMALQHHRSDRTVSTSVETTVTFGPLEDDEITTYIGTGSPMDKAGAYGIQDHTGPLFIEGITGDYYNVVGLPLRQLYKTLRADFPDLLDEE
jgi:septum formation protein